MTQRCTYCHRVVTAKAKEEARLRGHAATSCGRKLHTQMANRRRRKLIAAGLSGEALDREMQAAAIATGANRRRRLPAVLSPAGVSPESHDLDDLAAPQNAAREPVAVENDALEDIFATLDRIGGKL